MLGKKSKYFIFFAGLFFIYIFSIGRGFVEIGEGLINTVFPDKVITSLSENGHLKQYESFKIEADNSLDLSSVSINIISFNSNLTYFPGGSISVLFEPKGILPLDNVFQLEMSDANGSFASPEVIAIANEFFTPILNGKIPTSIVPGTGYKLRISYGSEVGPRLNYELPNAFGISSNNTPFPTPYVNVSETADGVDFRCLENPNTTTNPNYHFGSVEQGSSAVLLNDLNMSDPVSSWGPNTTARLYSLNSGSWSSSNLPITGLGTRSIKIPSGTPIGYYLIEFTKTISGQSSTYSYLFNFNTGNSGISNLDNDNICVDASVSFEIAKQSMRNNYPGSKYTINWGDGSPEEVYTHSELMESESLSHVFKSSTCSSEESDLRLGKYYFEVGFLLFNKGSSKNTICDDYSQNGNGAFKLVNTSVAPTAVVDAPEYICEGDNLTATDISIRGQYGDGNVCLTEYIREWLITPPGGAEELVDLSVDDDGNYIFPVYASWVDENGNLNLPGDIVSPGCWSIKLRIKNPSTAGCKISTEAITPVNVQAIPVPAFAIDKGPEICKDETIAFTDNSNVLDFLCQNPTYEWIVTPVAPPAIESGFEFTEGTDSSSPDPKIKFTQPGAYNVVLKITNACGPVSSAPQRIDVLGAPKVIFDNDELLVCRTSPEFNLDFSDGVINPTFGEFPFAPETYKWEVFKDDEITPADMDSYEFVVPSIDEDQLPIIKFKKYGIYKIKITVTTKCNDSSFDFFRFELREEPVITNEDINQNICSGETTKEIVFTSSMPDPGTTFRWIVAPVDGLSGYVPTGTGPKIEPRLLQNTTNLPLELIYKVVASNNGCDSEEKQFTITVNPTPVISNKAPEPICSGDAFTVNPEDGVSGDIVPLNTNYTWTMSPSDIGLVGVLSGSDVTIISEVLTNNTNTVQKATYTVTPKSGACEGDPFVIEVTVNPVPVVEAAPNSDVICSDGTTYITLSPKSTGTTAMTFSWTASVTTSPAGIGADITGFSTQSATGIQSVIEDKLINTGTSPGVVTYEITPYFGDCAGTTISVPVTVNPAGQVDQEDDQVICQGEDTQAINFSTINTIGITTYAWEIDKNIGLFPLSGIGNIPAFKGVNASSESIVATVTVRPTFTHEGESCEGAPMTFTITVNPVAQVLADPAFEAICSGDETGIKLSSTTTGTETVTYTWIAVQSEAPIGGVIVGFENHTTKTLSEINQILINSGTSPGKVKYTIIPHIGNCTGNPLDVEITVNPIARVNDISDQILCAGDDTDLITFGTINTGGTITYTWTNDNTAIGLAASSGGDVTEIPVFKALNPSKEPITATITVTPTFTNGSVSCPGLGKTFTITVNPTPVISNKAPEPICSGDAFTVNPEDGVSGDLVPLNTNYTWTMSPSDIGLIGVLSGSDVTTISEVLTNNTNTVQTATYTVTPKSGACEGDPFVIEVTVNPVAVVEAAPNSDVICSDGTTYITLSPKSTGTTAMTFSWTASVTTSPAGIGADITGFSTQNATGIQSVIEDKLINTGTSPGVVTYEITPYFGDCAGTTISVPVTVSPAGQVDQEDDQVICQGEDTQAINFSTINTIGITTYAWEIDKNIGLFPLSGIGNIPAFKGVNASSESIVATVTVRPTFTHEGESCEGAPMTFTITVNPVAQVLADPAFEVICSGDETGIKLSSTTTGTETVTYTWIAVQSEAPIGGVIVGFENHTTKTLSEINQILINSGTSPGKVKYTIIPHIGNCTGNPLDVEITVNPIARVNDISDQILCAGDDTDLITFGTINTGGTITYSWTNDNTAIGLAASSGGDVTEIPVFKALNPSKEPITATITVTPTFTNGSVSCPGLGKTFTITVNPTPVISNKAPEPICSGDAFTVNPVNVLGGDIVPSGTTYTWTVKTVDPAISGATASNTAGVVSISQMLTNSTNTVKAVIYLVTPTSGDDGSCVGDAFEIEVTVNPVAEVVATPDSEVICSEGSTNIQLSTPTSGTQAITYSWTAVITTPSTGGTISGFSDQSPSSLDKIIQPLTNSGTSPGVVTYTITPHIGDCAGRSIDVDVTVNPSGQADSVDDQIVCTGSSTQLVTFTTQNTVGITTYVWTMDTEIGAGLSGSGNLPAFTTVNITNAPIVAKVTVTPTFTNGGVSCPGPPETFTITVDPVAEVVATPASEVICSEDNTGIQLSTPTTGTQAITYSWTASITALPIGGTITGFTNQIPSSLDEIIQPLTNSGTSPGVVTYTITPHIGDCLGTEITVAVTVNPTAQVDGIDDQELCSGESTQLVVFNTENSGVTTTYTWTNDNTAIGLAASSGGDVTEIPVFKALNPSKEPITATITVTPTFTNGSVSCPGLGKTFTITVNPTPVISNKAPEPICSGDAFTVNPEDGVSGDLVPLNTNYTWTMSPSDIGLIGVLSGSDVTTISEVLTNNTNTVQTATYTVTPKSGACEGDPFVIEVTVNPVAVVEAAPNSDVICSDGTTNITLSPQSTGTVGMTYSWTASVTTIPAGTDATINGFSDQATPSSLAEIIQTLTNTGTSPGVVTYTITPHIGDCAGTPIDVDVTVNPSGQADSVDDQIVCTGSSTQLVTFTTQNTVGITTYAWTMDTDIGAGLSGSGNLSAFTTVNITNAPIVATVTVTPTFTNGGVSCQGPPETFTITVDPVAEVVATPASEVICSEDNTGIQLSTPTTGTQAITYSWTASITASPIGGTITGFTNQIPSSLDEIIQPLTNSGTSPGVVTYTITPHIGDCLGTEITVAVTVNPTAQVDGIDDQELCAGATTDLITFGTVNSGGTTTYTWTNDNAAIGLAASSGGNVPAIPSFTALNPTSEPIRAIVTVTPTFTNGGVSCSGTPETFTITVNPTPVIEDKDTEICSGDTFNIVPVDEAEGDIVPSGTTYTWTVKTVDPAISGATASNTAGVVSISQMLTNSTNTVKAVIYLVTPTSGDDGSCVGDAFEIEVTVNPVAEVVATPDSEVICSEGSTNIQLSTPTSGTQAITYSWTAVITTPSTGGTISGFSDQSPSSLDKIIQPLTNSGTSPGVVTYTITPHIGDCAGRSIDVDVTVNPSGQADSVDDQIVCTGSSTQLVTFTTQNTVGITTYVWTMDTEIGAGLSGSGNLPAFTTVNITNAPIVAKVTVTPTFTNGGVSCPGPPETFTITVDPVAEVVATPASEVICSEDNTGIQLSTPTTGTQAITYSWTASITALPIGGTITGFTNQIPSSLDEIIQPLTNSGTSPGVVTYTITPHIGDCLGTEITVAVTVNPTAQVDGIDDQELCSGESTQLVVFNTENSGVTTTYTWTNDNTAIGLAASSGGDVTEIPVFKALNPSKEPITATITVTPTFTNGSVSCPGLGKTFTITVNPTPVISNKAPEPICSGDAFTVNPVNVLGGDIVPAGTTYTWTIKSADAGISGAEPSSAVGVISQTLTNSTNTVKAVIYLVTPTSGDDGSCVGDAFEIEVTVNPTPVIGDKIAPEICSNGLFEFEPVNVLGGDIVPLGTTYTWTVAANADVVGQSDQITTAQQKISQTLRNLTNTPKTLVYTVTPLVGTCAGDSFTVTVTINPTPEIAKKEAEICSENTFEVDPLTLAELGDIIPANTTYTWTVASNTNLTGQSDVSDRQSKISQTLTNLTNEVRTVIYTVTPYSEAVGGCEGLPFEIEVTVNPTPVIEDKIAPEICSNGDLNFVAVNGQDNDIVPVGTKYTWTIKTDNANIEGQLLEADPQDRVIQILRNLTITSQTIVYEVTPISGDCAGDTFELSVTVTPTPEIEDVESGICSEEFFVVEPLKGGGVSGNDIVPTNTVYTWTVVDNENVTGDVDEPSFQTIITQQLTNLTNEAQVVVYTVTPYAEADGSCPGETFEVRVTVNPKPTIEDVESEICSEEFFVVEPVNGGGVSGNDIVPTNTVYTWTVVDNENVTGDVDEPSFQTLITQQLTNMSNEEQVVVYTVTPYAEVDGSCPGETFEVRITVKPTPVISPKELVICSEDDFELGPIHGENGDIIPLGTKYIWMVIQNVGGIIGPTNEDSPQDKISSDALINPGNTPSVVVYEVTPISADGCEGDSFTLSITVKDPIVIQGDHLNYNGFGVSCFGAEDGFIQVTVSGGKLPTEDPDDYNYSWLGPDGFSANSKDISGLNPGTYILTVDDNSGLCLMTKSFEITEPTPVVVTEQISSYNGFEISCFGASDGSISLDVSGGAGGYTYAWVATNGGEIPSGMENQALLDNLIAGTYIVTVTDANGCAQDIDYTLRQPAPLELREIVDQRRNVLCYGEDTGQISLLATGGVKDYRYNLAGVDFEGEQVDLISGITGLNNYIFENLKAGVYTLSVLDLNGCVTALPGNITISQPDAPLAISNEVLSDYSGFNIACFGDLNGSISLQVSGGTAPYTYAWMGPNGFTSTALNLSGLGAGKYTLVIKDANDCILEKEFELVEPAPITVNALPQNVLCGAESNGNIFIRGFSGGTGNYQFLWVKDGVGEIRRTFVPEDLRNIGPGKYFLIATDENSCEYIEEFVITEPDPLVVSLMDKSDNLCFGENNGALTIDVTGGVGPYVYQWTGPNGYTSSNKDLGGLFSGVYELVLMDALQCTQSLTVTIDEPEEIIIEELIDNVSCFGGNNGAIRLTVSGGVPPYRYLWLGPNGFTSTSRDIRDLIAGEYELLITDQIGCVITREFEINQPEPIVIDANISSYNGFQISCKGGSDGFIDITITGGNGGYRIFWEGPNGFRSNLSKIEGLLPGAYELAVIDEKNCLQTAQYLLVAPEELLITEEDLIFKDVSCFGGKDGSLQVNITQASVGPYRFELVGKSVDGFPFAESVLVDELLYEFTGLRSGEYELTVSDANGCSLSELSGLKIDQPESPLNFDILKTDNTCYKSNDGKIQITPTGGTAPYTIIWTNGSQSFSMENLSPGLYGAIITDAKGCEVKFETELIEAPIFELREEVNRISCFGLKDGSINLNIVGGEAPLLIQWGHGPQEPILNNLEKGIYSVTIIDAGGCVIKKDFVINEPQPLELTGNVSDAFDCEDPNSGAINIIPFGGTAPYTFNWSNGENSQNLNNIGPGSYSLELIDANGCSIVRQFTILRPEALKISVSRTTERICDPRGLKSYFEVSISGGIAPYSIQWNRGNVSNNGASMETDELGVFIVTVKDSRGCPLEQSFQVIEEDPLIPEFDFKSNSYEFSYENLVNFDIQFSNLSQGVYKEIVWEFGDGSTSTQWEPIHKYAKPGTYQITLKLKDLDGCIVEMRKEIVITDFFFEVPNVFTPNGDGVNDYFYPKFLYIKDIHVMIMNKWGELIYESKDLDAAGWNGKLKEEDAVIGNYAYRIQFTTLDGRLIDRSSVFLLAR